MYEVSESMLSFANKADPHAFFLLGDFFKAGSLGYFFDQVLGKTTHWKHRIA